MTAPDVAALEAARAAATGGEWAATSERADGGAYIDVPERYRQGLVPPWVGHASSAADAALIVAAVNALPDLLAAVRERDALRAAVAGLAEDHRRWAVTNRDLADRMDGSDIDFHIGMAQAQEASTKHLCALLAAVDGGQR